MSVEGTAVSSQAPPLTEIALAAIAARVSVDALQQDPRVHRLRRAVSNFTSTDGWSSAAELAQTHAAPEDAILTELARSLRLSTFETLSIALACSVECDLEIAELMAYLQEPLSTARPSVGLVTRAFCLEGSVAAVLQGPAMRCGLLVLSESAAPLPERTLSVPLPLVLALRGESSSWPDAIAGLPESNRVPLHAAEIERVRRQAKSLEASGERSLALRASSMHESKTAAAIFAQELGLEPLYLAGPAAPGLAPWLLLKRMLPVHCLSLAIGERRNFPHIAGYNGPALALLSVDGELETDRGPVLGWKVGVPEANDREALWLSQIGQPELAARLAVEYRLRAGRIFDLCRLARHQAALDNRSEIEASDVFRAAQSGEAVGISSLADLVQADIPDDALIVPRALRKDLEALCLRCRAREFLADGLGASMRTRYRPSVQALFVGPSGTGKTLAALWLASRLKLPLYRVDLAAITSKYIGDTEKNVSHLLTCAEQAGVMLLFDEADSMFGRRTDVKDSNDRFANAQTNYLLQRMENFDGIAILTSNSRARLDSAFSRRLEMILEFVPPDAAQRRQLWDSHLGETHGLSAAEINHLAVNSDLNGGEIRNAVLAAAAEAAANRRPLQLQDALCGLQGEYRKAGRHIPEAVVRIMNSKES